MNGILGRLLAVAAAVFGRKPRRPALPDAPIVTNSTQPYSPHPVIESPEPRRGYGCNYTAPNHLRWKNRRAAIARRRNWPGWKLRRIEARVTLRQQSLFTNKQMTGA